MGYHAAFTHIIPVFEKRIKKLLTWIAWPVDEPSPNDVWQMEINRLYLLAKYRRANPLSTKKDIIDLTNDLAFLEDPRTRLHHRETVRHRKMKKECLDAMHKGLTSVKDTSSKILHPIMDLFIKRIRELQAEVNAQLYNTMKEGYCSLCGYKGGWNPYKKCGKYKTKKRRKKKKYVNETCRWTWVHHDVVVPKVLPKRTWKRLLKEA